MNKELQFFIYNTPQEDIKVDDFKEIISSAVIIDQKEIDEMKPVIESEEVAVFEHNNYY